jgi:hypothetical protein
MNTPNTKAILNISDYTTNTEIILGRKTIMEELPREGNYLGGSRTIPNRRENF